MLAAMGTTVSVSKNVEVNIADEAPSESSKRSMKRQDNQPSSKFKENQPSSKFKPMKLRPKVCVLIVVKHDG